MKYKNKYQKMKTKESMNRTPRWCRSNLNCFHETNPAFWWAAVDEDNDDDDDDGHDDDNDDDDDDDDDDELT